MAKCGAYQHGNLVGTLRCEPKNDCLRSSRGSADIVCSAPGGLQGHQGQHRAGMKAPDFSAHHCDFGPNQLFPKRLSKAFRSRMNERRHRRSAVYGSSIQNSDGIVCAKGFWKQRGRRKRRDSNCVTIWRKSEKRAVEWKTLADGPVPGPSMGARPPRHRERGSGTPPACRFASSALAKRRRRMSSLTKTPLPFRLLRQSKVMSRSQARLAGNFGIGEKSQNGLAT